MEAGESLHAVETVILLLLVLVAGFAAFARRLKVPYPIVLVLAGLAISFVPRMPKVPLDPNVVFVVFLPPLLYSSAWLISWREFRRNAVLIGLLAVGLVGFTVWGVAEFSDRFITALYWKPGFYWEPWWRRQMRLQRRRLLKPSDCRGGSSTFWRVKVY